MNNKYALFLNTMAFGDTLFGMNSARRFKEHNPDWLVAFTVRENFNLTTNDGRSGMYEAIEVYSKQPWLDGVGYVARYENTEQYRVVLTNEELAKRNPDLFVLQNIWWTDFGNNKSNNYHIKDYLPEEALNDGNLVLNVESTKINDDTLRIGVSGPLDWNRKLQSEKTRIEVLRGLKEILAKRKIKAEINLFGVEVSNNTLYQSLCHLNTQDIFIGPIGSLHHAAAALDVDTISIPSIFPTTLDTPRYYSTRGIHLNVEHRTENHCGVKETKCLDTKYYADKNTFKGQEGPFAHLGFWPRKCPHTQSGWACTKSVVAQDVLNTFEGWLNEKYK